MSLFLSSIKLGNFRNYFSSENVFEFHKKIVFIIGPNAVGKSNLIEAINYLAFGANRDSDRVLHCLHADQPFFKLEAEYKIEDRDFKLTVASGKDLKNINLNGVTHRFWSGLADELIKVVFFKAKESIELVRGAPAKRRDWLDTVLSLLDKRYAEALKRYLRVVEQRNSLLKQLYEGKPKKQIIAELEPWDLELAKYGFLLSDKRKNFIEANQPIFIESYKKIATSVEAVPAEIVEEPALKYISSFEEDFENGQRMKSQEDFLKQIQAKHEADLARGQTLLGPHREEFTFLLDGQEAKLFASQGQQRTCALALKLAQLEIWQKHLGYYPILLLDDVTAELDLARQEALFKAIPGGVQVFITTTHLVNLPLALNGSLHSDYQIIKLDKT